MDTTPTTTGSGFKVWAKDWAKRHPKATGLGALALVAFVIYANASSPSDSSSATLSPAAPKTHAPAPKAEAAVPNAQAPAPKAPPAPSHTQVTASAIIDVMKAKGAFGKLCAMQAEATTSALQQIEFAAFARGYGWQHSPSNDGTPTPRVMWEALTQACAR